MTVRDGRGHSEANAVVFDASWDLHGALTVTSGGPARNIDLVTPNVTAKADGLFISLYGGYQYSYANLYVYNFTKKKIYALRNFKVAQQYFQTFKPQRDCPPSKYGVGVEIF